MGKGMKPKKGYNQKKYLDNYDSIVWSKPKSNTQDKKEMNIGTKVKHNDQDIVGTIIRYDCGDKVVIKLDDEDTTLSYHPRELTITK